jgi:hypothetical protein
VHSLWSNRKHTGASHDISQTKRRRSRCADAAGILLAAAGWGVTSSVLGAALIVIGTVALGTGKPLLDASASAGA